MIALKLYNISKPLTNLALKSHFETITTTQL